MTPDIIQELSHDGEPSPFHKAILQHVKSLVKMSRVSMAKNYRAWDLQDDVYRGLRRPDDKDLRAAAKDEPEKMIVPHTFAQVMTFTSFLFLMFNQNRRFFELSPNGVNNYAKKDQDCETIIQRDLQHNQWNRLLFQHLLDVSRFGPAIIECGWTRRTSNIWVAPEPQVITYQGVTQTIRGDSEWQEFVKYEGNYVRSVSPFKFFPDTRHALCDFQQGEFCAAEEEYSQARLRDLQKSGEVAGVDNIPSLPNNWNIERGGSTRSTITPDDRQQPLVGMMGNNSRNNPVIVTKVQVWIVPSKFKFGPKDKPLGPETFPVLYHVWYANDSRIIRCEPAYWWHNQFGWSVSQFTPDMHQTVNLGLADLIYRLQDVMSWFVNAHISSVRRVMQNRLVVNPEYVETKSLDGEGDIYVRKGMKNAQLDRAVYQLKVQDVTAAHMGDVEMLSKLMEAVTGVNGNAMGQYNSGRRSAQEARQVSSGSAGRMKMHASLIWETGLSPLGQMMLSNSRQSLSQDSFVRVMGLANDPTAPQRFTDFAGTPDEIVGGDSFFTYDSTLSSEKGFIAQSLQSLVEVTLSNPQMAQALDLDPKAMIQEIQYLQGAGPIERFSLSRNIALGITPPPPPLPVAPQTGLSSGAPVPVV